MENNEFFHLFVDQLRDLYDAEKQLADALPILSESATTPKLKEAFRTYTIDAKTQIARLEEMFISLNEAPIGRSCETMEALVKESQSCINNYYSSAVRDAALIAAIQRIKHFEMAVYGTLRTFAKELDLDDMACILQKSLDEEGKANKTLTSIAEGGIFMSGVNQKALRS